MYKKGAGDLLIPQFERAQQRLNFSGVRIAQRRRKIKQLFNQYELYFSDQSREALISFIAEKTEGHVGSDLQSLCREAGMLALRDGSTKVTKSHFEAAYEKVHPMNERELEIITEKFNKVSKVAFQNRCSHRNISNFFSRIIAYHYAIIPFS